MWYLDLLKIATPVLSGMLLATLGFVAALIRSVATLTASTKQLSVLVDDLCVRSSKHDDRLRAVEIEHAVMKSRIPPSADIAPARPRHRG